MDENKIKHCEKCNKTFQSNAHYLIHCETMKIHILNNHSNIKEKKLGFKYYCEICDIGYVVEHKFNTHLNTLKHKIKVIAISNDNH